MDGLTLLGGADVAVDLRRRLARRVPQQLLGDPRINADYAALDWLIPHPVNAKQHWVAILNPTEATFRETVLPLLAEAHDRLVRVREHQAEARADDEGSEA